MFIHVLKKRTIHFGEKKFTNNHALFLFILSRFDLVSIVLPISILSLTAVSEHLKR